MSPYALVPTWKSSRPALVLSMNRPTPSVIDHEEISEVMSVPAVPFWGKLSSGVPDTTLNVMVRVGVVPLQNSPKQSDTGKSLLVYVYTVSARSEPGSPTHSKQSKPIESNNLARIFIEPPSRIAKSSTQSPSSPEIDRRDPKERW